MISETANIMSEKEKNRRYVMSKFELPHQHGKHAEHGSIEYIYNELSNMTQFDVVAEIFKQLSDPTRVRIFWLLCHKEECVINIAAWMNMSSPAVSHHIRSLHQCGLIVSRRDGKEVYYKAAESEESNLLHKAVEKAMEIACPEEIVDNNNSAEEIIYKIHKYLVEHISERITIDELSKKFLLNPTTLKKVFKEVYGVSIAAHMKQHRMEEAARLLRESQMSIAQIAQNVGYESQSRFSEAFRDYFGMPPKEYRKYDTGRRNDKM